MTESVTYGQLERFLLSLGFKRYRAEASHVFFEHKASGAGIVVKDYEANEPVHSTKLVGVRGTLHHSGLVDRDEFEGRLEQSTVSAKAG
jgi:predicted RNA binding protein YcfA (HicA-like mRNA interferase family)